uniref:Ig-like domain-containing protein n=1 Tax=Sphaeramia orbicularis TaxID=375764 RepID=A0A672ZFF4_9TELE
MNVLLLRVFTFTSVFTGPMVVLASTTETVVGVAGGRVLLPCRSAAANQDGVEVCWGRGEPSLFTCHNTVMNSKGGVVKYRSSNRFSVSSTVYGRHASMSIYKTRPSDSGFYHCRVQVPGPFNDQTFTVHLIVISPQSVVSDSSESANVNKQTLNTPHTTVSKFIRAAMETLKGQTAVEVDAAY